MSTTALNIPRPLSKDWPVMAVSAAVAPALVFLFHAGIINLWNRWGGQQELSHSYFIPLITLYMLWDRREALAQSLGKSNSVALGLFGMAIVMAVGLKALNVFLLEHAGLMIALFAVPLLVGGVSLFRVCFFPIAYLIFMIPPPFWVITVTSWNFQLWSSELGVAMIRMFDIPVLLSGNVIELPNMTLAVVEACSGLRYLFPFLSLGALAAFFYKGPLWQRAIVVLATIPITIFMNSFRIAITGVLTAEGDASHTEGVLHFFEGYVVFIMCIALLLGLLVIMARLSGKRNVLSGLGLPEVKPITPDEPWNRQRYIVLAGAAAGLIAVSGAIIHSTESKIVIPDRQDFDELSLEFGPGWKVEESVLDVNTERVLNADDYIVLNLESPEGEIFNLYTAYLVYQKDGGSWHSPQQCLPGGGWRITHNDIVEASREGGESYHYNRLIIKNGDTRYLVHYYYDQRGRRIANEFMMKIALVWDVLTQRRSDGAMIRLMTPILPEDGVEGAEERMRWFQLRVEELTPPYIPA